VERAFTEIQHQGLTQAETKELIQALANKQGLKLTEKTSDVKLISVALNFDTAMGPASTTETFPTPVTMKVDDSVQIRWTYEGLNSNKK
jgi:hypothetical protein